MRRLIKVVVTYRVCQHWRAPVFVKIGNHPEIELCVLHGQDVPGTKLVNGENLSGFRHRELWTIKWSGIPWVLHPFLLLSLIRENPDVIIAEGGSNFWNNFIVFTYSRISRKPVVWWTLGALSKKQYTGLGALYRRLALWQERLSSAFLGYSSAAVQHFHDMGYDPRKCFRAVNVVDTDRILRRATQDVNEAKQLKVKFGVTDKQVVLFVGALTVSKSIDRLIRVFARLHATMPEIHLLLVGDGSDRPRLESIASKLMGNSNYTFTGSVTQGIGAYYELAEVFVLPGLGGLAVSESLAHGVPVVCGRGDGSELDLVVDGETGYRTSSSDDREVERFLECKLRLILGDRAHRQRLSENALLMIRNQFNVGTYLENVVDAIRFAHTGKRETPLPAVGNAQFLESQAAGAP